MARKNPVGLRIASISSRSAPARSAAVGVLREQRRRDLVDHDVGGLRGQHGGDEQLQRALEVELAVRIGVALGRARYIRRARLVSATGDSSRTTADTRTDYGSLLTGDVAHCPRGSRRGETSPPVRGPRRRGCRAPAWPMISLASSAATCSSTRATGRHALRHRARARSSSGARSADGRENLVAILGPGEMFGELSLFDPGPRTMTATAVAETQLLGLGNDSLTRPARRPPRGRQGAARGARPTAASHQRDTSPTSSSPTFPVAWPRRCSTCPSDSAGRSRRHHGLPRPHPGGARPARRRLA